MYTPILPHELIMEYEIMEEWGRNLALVLWNYSQVPSRIQLGIWVLYFCKITPIYSIYILPT